MANLFVSSETKFELLSLSAQHSFSCLACHLPSMVNTRLKNKDAHPGVPDQPTPRPAKATNTTLQNKHQLAIQKVAAIEHKLIEDQQCINNNAQRPPGLSRSDKRQVAAAGMNSQRTSLATSSHLHPGTYPVQFQMQAVVLMNSGCRYKQSTDVRSHKLAHTSR